MSHPPWNWNDPPRPEGDASAAWWRAYGGYGGPAQPGVPGQSPAPGHPGHPAGPGQPWPGQPWPGQQSAYDYPTAYGYPGHPASAYPGSRGRPGAGDLLRRLSARARELRRSAPADLLATAAPALPHWVRADAARRALEHSERRADRPVRRARARAAFSARAWTVAAAISPAAAVVDGAWGWLVVGGAALVRAGLSFREVRILNRSGQGALPLPTTAPPSALALRRSAAAEPLARGEAGLAALAAMVRSVQAGPAVGPIQGAMAGAAELVDGLRANARRVLACEAAARAVADPRRRAEVQATADRLVAVMREAADALEALLGAASEVVGIATATSPELARLTDEIEALRGYAAGLRELTGLDS